ncbi:MAG: hypothetical protein GY906_23550 [bacterium]|nr:hypothetical protein [bacterium]
MLEQSDTFWDVRAQEKAEEQAFERQITDLDKAIAVGQKANQIRNAAGFSAFVKAVEDLRNVACHKMVTDTTLTNDGLREMRSRVRSLDDVLALLTKENITDHLEARRAASQNDLEAARRRRPTKQEVTT